MLLLVVSMSNETTAPTSTVTFERPDFVLSQVGIPIYEFIPPEVNASYAEDLAYSLFRMIDSSATDAEDRYIVESGNKTFEMNKRDGSIWYADYDYLWNVAEGIIDHSPSMCRDKADTWLDEKGILPSTFVFTNYGSTNATAWNIDAGDSQSKVLQWHVNYEMFIGDIPVTGPGEQISVMIGGFGEIVGLSWNHRELKAEPYATLPLIEYESILEHYGISPEDVVEHKLVSITIEITHPTIHQKTGPILPTVGNRQFNTRHTVAIGIPGFGHLLAGKFWIITDIEVSL